MRFPALERGLGAGFHRQLDRRHVVVVAHADGDAVAGIDGKEALSDHHGAFAFEDQPVLVAVVIVEVEAGILRIVDRIALDHGWPVGAPGEDAAAAKFIAPAATQHHRLRRARGPAELPAGFGGEVEELSFADHLGAEAGDDLQAARRRNDAFLALRRGKSRLSPAARLTTSNVSSSHQAGGRIEFVNTLTGWNSSLWIGAEIAGVGGHSSTPRGRLSDWRIC